MTRARDIANLIGSGNYNSTTFTATAGQTAFTISHTQGFVQVFMNGLLLDETVDYTSNGTAITLTSGAAAGDEIEVVAYNTFSVGDAITQTAADTRYVNTTGDTISGTLGVTGVTTMSDDLIVNSNVGIGSSSPSSNNGVLSRTVEIRGTNNNVINGTTDTGGMNGLILEASHSARSPQPRYAQVGMGVDASGNGTMTFFTAAAAGYVTEKMRIDQAGRVTTPNQPMACAGSTMGGAGSNLHPASTIYVQKGGANLAANGRFTCPVAGVYRATLTGYTNYTSSYGYIYLKKNGSQHGYNHHFNHNASNYTFHSIVAMSQLVDCAANDYLEFWGGAGNGYVHYSNITFELAG